MGEDLVVDCPRCGDEAVFMFNGDINGIENEEVEITCKNCKHAFIISVIEQIEYSIQIEDTKI